MILLSGIQPTGRLHIGNYLGAIKNWQEFQNKYTSIFCVVDYHAITVYQDPKELKQNIYETTALLFAAGIDPKQSTVFVQSHISAHTELTWIINCITPMGWLERMTQFKDKSQKQGKERVGVGLFDYPALMASDILLYNTDVVPVGEDQKQHVELTRDIAGRFNKLYGKIFKLPKAIIPETGARIMGLDDPDKKMSKSDETYGHAIYLLDSPDDIRKKIMRATTDSLKDIRFDKKRPGIYNLLTLYERFTGDSRKAIEKRFQGKGYAEFKQELADIIVEGLRPLQNKYKELTVDKSYIESLLKQGADKARPLAEKTLQLVKNKMGLL
ncbi:tryptophan--tRNA ligase [Patescibacteria group bacterium AH-259-L05]|nr:tryptophan--tRNA ligase [Patescibacteria group bacterium AH-259-L05]